MELPAAEGHDAEVFSLEDIDVAQSAADSHEIVARLLSENGGKYGDWRPAMIEGEERGAYILIQLSEPLTGDLVGLRPDVEALIERHAPTVDHEAAGHDHGKDGVDRLRGKTTRRPFLTG